LVANGCKKRKYVADGILSKHKAHLVAKSPKRRGINYSETFVPVALMDSIQMIFSIAASLNWKVR